MGWNGYWEAGRFIRSFWCGIEGQGRVFVSASFISRGRFWWLGGQFEIWWGFIDFLVRAGKVRVWGLKAERGLNGEVVGRCDIVSLDIESGGIEMT